MNASCLFLNANNKIVNCITMHNLFVVFAW